MFRDSLEDIRDYGLRRGWKARETGMILTMSKGGRVLIVTFGKDGHVSAARVGGTDITGAGKMASIRKELDR